MARLQYFRRALEILWRCCGVLLQVAGAKLGLSKPVPGPQRLRTLLEQLGGSFLKFGQILSLQLDSLPREYCDALLNLLDRVPAFGRDEVRQVFYAEFTKRPEELFQQFTYTPVASASIGQVHRATLRDGRTVAVKVQRPGVQEVFRRDAALLKFFVRLIFFFRLRTLYFMRDPIREFNDWLQDELDYKREAAYGEVLGRNAQQTPAERVPAIHWDLTTSRVLTMDFLEGYTVLEYLRALDQHDELRQAELAQLGFDPPQFLSNVIENFLSDAFRFGIFHADLHPANLLILKDNVVGYVDFGIVGHLSPEARRKLIQLSLAYARGHTEEIYDAFLSVSSSTEEVDLTGFHAELERRTRQWYREPAIGGVPQLRRSLTSAMFDLLALCRNYGLLIDREMVKYIRSLILVDGLVTRLAPKLDLAPQIRRVCEAFYAREAQSRIVSREAALGLLTDLAGWLLAGPERVLSAMERVERGELRIRARSAPRGLRGDALRGKAMLLAAVWFLLAFFVLTGWQNAPYAGISPASVLLVGFWGGCTIWILRLLRRLVNP